MRASAAGAESGGCGGKSKERRPEGAQDLWAAGKGLARRRRGASRGGGWKRACGRREELLGVKRRAAGVHWETRGKGVGETASRREEQGAARRRASGALLQAQFAQGEGAAFLSVHPPARHTVHNAHFVLRSMSAIV